MRVIRFHETGDPDAVLRCESGDIPDPGPGQVRVKMLASPINPSDLMFVRGVYGVKPELPATPGFEGVGIVDASGPGLLGRLLRGKRAVVLSRQGGNWAEYTVVPSRQVIPVTSDLSLDEAATFFVNPATAWIMTQQVLRVPGDGWLLQTAAASSLGRMIVRLGNHLGFRTLNIVRRDDQVDVVRQAGGQHVHVFDGDDDDALRSIIRDVTGEDGIRFAIDPVGGATGSALIRCLGPRAHLLLYGTLDDSPLQLSPRSLMAASARIEGFWLGNAMDGFHLPAKLRLIRRLTRLIRSGVFATDVAHWFELDDIGDAVRAAESRGRTGKALLRVAESG